MSADTLTYGSLNTNAQVVTLANYIPHSCLGFIVCYINRLCTILGIERHEIRSESVCCLLFVNGYRKNRDWHMRTSIPPIHVTSRTMIQTAMWKVEDEKSA